MPFGGTRRDDDHRKRRDDHDRRGRGRQPVLRRGLEDVAGQLHIAGIGEITAGTGCAGDFSDATCPGTRIVMHGADGDDELDVRTASLVSISFAGGAGNDTLGASDIDPRWADAAMTFAGGDGDDQVIGSTQPDQIDGGAGFDRLDGRGGNDAITGGDGGDTLRGGAGADTIAGGARR